MISKPITRLVAIRHQPLRVDARAGDGTGHRCGCAVASKPVSSCCSPSSMPPRSGIDIIRFDVPGVGGSAHGGNSRARTDDVRRLFWANPLCSEPGFDTR